MAEDRQVRLAAFGRVQEVLNDLSPVGRAIVLAWAQAIYGPNEYPADFKCEKEPARRLRDED